MRNAENLISFLWLRYGNDWANYLLAAVDVAQAKASADYQLHNDRNELHTHNASDGLHKTYTAANCSQNAPTHAIVLGQTCMRSDLLMRHPDRTCSQTCTHSYYVCMLVKIRAIEWHICSKHVQYMQRISYNT